MTITYDTILGEPARQPAELLELCRVAFDAFEASYLTSRLPHVDAPSLVTARFASGALAGFKLGYRRGTTLFYSWLGGVHPEARRQGVGVELMRLQHTWAKEQGFTTVETRARAANNAMLILNLQAGFQIRGIEVDASGTPVVILRKGL